jgi:catechol 2,3-dioxygenase-like lactoylglutathione lyase family enzyme
MATRKTGKTGKSKASRTKTRTASTRSRTTKAKAKTKAKGKSKTTSKKPSSRAAILRRPMRQDPESLRLRSFEPSFTVNDLSESIRFYTGLLGFIVGERWTDAEGVLRGVMLKAGACELGLAQDDWAKGRDRKKGEAVRIWCQTAQDIDAIAARIKAGGGRLTEEPHDQWGSRSLSIDDPDGFHLTIYRES